MVGFVINAGVIEPGSDYDDINFTDGLGLNFGILADFLVSNSINLGLPIGYSGTEGKVLPNISLVRPFIYLGMGGVVIKNSGKSLHGREYDNMFNLPKVNAGIGIEFRITKDLSVGLQTELQSYFSDKTDGHYGSSKYNQGDDLFLAKSILLGFRHLE